MTPSYFLSWKLGHTPSSARHLLGIATKLEDHPQITAAFSAGELSLAQTNILMDISEPETEEELLELAHGLSGGQLSRFAGLYRSALRAEQDTSHRDRYLRTTHRDDGSWRITGSLSSENGAIFDRALRAATQKMTADGYTRDEHATDPWAAEDADALLYLGEHLLSGGQGIRPNHERFQVVVHLDVDKLDQSAVCRLQDGGIISSDSARRLLCDSSVLEMIHKGDEVLHLGRTSRRPNRAMRRVLEAKQHCCAFPGCARKGVSAHHIEWWARDNGTTDIDNLVLLCHSHHRAIHDGDITIGDSEAGLTFKDRGGTVIERPHLRATSELASINRARGICVTEETCLPWLGWRTRRSHLRRRRLRLEQVVRAATTGRSIDRSTHRTRRPSGALALEVPSGSSQESGDTSRNRALSSERFLVPLGCSLSNKESVMRRFIAPLLAAVLLVPLGASSAASSAPPAVPSISACASGDALDAGVELFGAGTEFVQTDRVAGLTTALVLEPYIAPGTRHRMIAVPGGWCDAESGFNHAWTANGRSFAESGAVAAAYARLAAAPYFDQTTVTSRSATAGVHTIATHSLTNGVDARWTIVTDAAGVRLAKWVSTGFANKPFVAQWEGLTAVDGANERYARLVDGLLTAERGLPTGGLDDPAAEVSYTSPDGFKIVVGIGDSRNAVDIGTDTGNSRVDLLRDFRRAIAQNYQDFYDWGFRAAWAPARTRFLVAQGPTQANIGPANTGYVSINDSTSAYCQACVFIADDFQIHMVSEVRPFLEALGYTYPGASDYDVLTDVLGHEMFHDWQNNYVKPTSTGRSVPGSYSEGTARMQESLHTYSGASHQPGSLVYANDANGCNGFSASDAGMAGGAFQTPAYAACNFWLPWYGARGVETLAKLVMEGAPAGAEVPNASNSKKVTHAIEVATGEPYARSAAQWAAGLITGKNMAWAPAVGAGETRNWAEYLNRWVPSTLAAGASATANLRDGGVMARRVNGGFVATISDGAILAVLRDSATGATLTYPAPGEAIPGPAQNEKLYVIGINPTTTPLSTTIGITGSGPAPPPPPSSTTPVATTLFMDGAQPAGEAEGLAYLQLTPQAGSSEKSMQLLNYVGGPNTNCAGNSLFPVFVGELSGKVTGDIKVTFTAASTAGAVDIRVWPDLSSQLCNEAYMPPSRSATVGLPTGSGVVQAVIPGSDLEAGSQIMIQITPVTTTPFLGRMFYGTASAKVEFDCIPSPGQADCI